MAIPNFFNENSGRAFPFTLTTYTDTLPKSAVVDFGAIMGSVSGFLTASDTVYLARITRAGTVFYFYFKTTAINVTDYWLIFTRDITETEYVTEYADAVRTSQTVPLPEESISIGENECAVLPTWSGYLTTGDLTELAATLSLDGDYTFSDPEIEPALIKNQSGGFVRSVNFANAERTRVNTPAECREPTWKIALSDVYVVGSCQVGRIRFRGGYNLSLSQSDADNSIQFNAEPGAGAGEVCDRVPLFVGELPPFGATTLDGGVTCDEVIRSINGVGGKVVQLLSGPGVSVVPDPDNHTVHISVHLNDLKACVDLPTPVELSDCSLSDIDEVSCGPAE